MVLRVVVCSQQLHVAWLSGLNPLIHATAYCCCTSSMLVAAQPAVRVVRGVHLPSPTHHVCVRAHLHRCQGPAHNLFQPVKQSATGHRGACQAVQQVLLGPACQQLEGSHVRRHGCQRAPQAFVRHHDFEHSLGQQQRPQL